MRALVTGEADATSGFRPYARAAALDLIVVNRYEYMMESTMQAGLGSLRTMWVPVRTHLQTRESGLIHSTFGYVRRDALTISRVVATYRPLRFFGALALLGDMLGDMLGFARMSATGRWSKFEQVT